MNIRTTQDLRTAIRTPFAWPGGYATYLIMDDGEALCMKCARENYALLSNATRTANNDGWRSLAMGVCDDHENTPSCTHCGDSIDPALRVPPPKGPFNRQQYMNKECSYREYYSQFVTKSVKRLVKTCITEKSILKSTDPSFNNIPLRQWDALHQAIWALIGSKVLALDPCGNSLGTTVCVAKEAALQIKEGAQ